MRITHYATSISFRVSHETKRDLTRLAAEKDQPPAEIVRTLIARWIEEQDGGDVITLSKRLGHSTPQITMTTYADAIEEANDHSIRKAHVNALFGSTKMAASLAASDGDNLRQTARTDDAEVVSLADVRGTSRQVANAGG